MDKYEFKLSLEEINRLIQERRYDEAADIADGIDWNHVGNANTLRRISEVYKAVGDYDRSRNVMAIALKREPENPAIIYSLCELTIYLYGRDGLQSDLASCMQLMQEYQALEPQNPKRLILQYKFYGVSGVSEQEKIQVLEQLRKEQFSARWGYELAKCYAGIGETKAAAQTCTDVIEIFGGRYGGRAQELLDQLNASSGSGQGAPASGEPLKERQTEQTVPQEKPAPSEVSGMAEKDSDAAAAEQPEEPEPVRTRPEPELPHPSDRAPKIPVQTPVQESVRTDPAAEAVREEETASPVEQDPMVSAAASVKEEPLAETGRQASINEVMAEWERIRADIRKANDEKRTQRILEDTGALLQDFEETARHSLLEDIEKGVARQRRQVRSGMYRTDEEYVREERPAGRYQEDIRVRSANRYRGEAPVQDRGVQSGQEESPAELIRERSSRRRPAEEEADQEESGRGAVQEDLPQEAAVPAAEYEDIPDETDRKEEQPAAPEETVYLEEPEPETEEDDTRNTARRVGIPVSNEDDDVKVYGRSSRVEEAVTRRWNTEEIHRLATHREQSGWVDVRKPDRRVTVYDVYGNEAPEQPRVYDAGQDALTEQETAAGSAADAADTPVPEGPSENPALQRRRVTAAPAEDIGETSYRRPAEPADRRPAAGETVRESADAAAEQVPPRRVRRIRRMTAGEDPYAGSYAETSSEAPKSAIREESPQTGAASAAVRNRKRPPARYDEPEEENSAARYEQPGGKSSAELYDEPEEESSAARYEQPGGKSSAALYDEPEEESSAALYNEPEERSSGELYDEREEENPPARDDEPGEENPEELYDEQEEEPLPAKRGTDRAAESARKAEILPGEKPQEKEESGSVPDGSSAGKVGRRELSREERRLFGPFCRMKENVEQLTEALDQISLDSSSGNLMILGNEATAERVARGILEILRHSDANFTGKIAKATGESLNKLDVKGVSAIFRKLENGSLIVIKAADIAPKTLERLHSELEQEHGMILIFTDGNKRMDQFRRENESCLGSFTAVINIRPLDDKALVAYAKDYAQSQDYSIDEFGQLALAQRISSMQTPTHHVTLKEVRDLVDEAISFASRKNPRVVMEIISRKRYDEDDRIILHEKDFTHY